MCYLDNIVLLVKNPIKTLTSATLLKPGATLAYNYERENTSQSKRWYDNSQFTGKILTTNQNAAYDKFHKKLKKQIKISKHVQNVSKFAKKSRGTLLDRSYGPYSEPDWSKKLTNWRQQLSIIRESRKLKLAKQRCEKYK